MRINIKTGPRAIAQGFTLVELMIVIVIVAILVTLSVPSYLGFVVRAKVSEGLILATTAKLAIFESCMTNPGISLDDNVDGYPQENVSKYVDSITLGGACDSPTVTIATTNTGGSPDPILVLTGESLQTYAALQWTCSTTTGVISHVPSSCRTASGITDDSSAGDDGNDDTSGKDNKKPKKTKKPKKPKKPKG